jgi:heme exporter protein A
MAEFAASELACVRGERLVFAGLACRVAGGGALVLRGPNGSGKSSLLRLMAGLARPAHGVLSWNGADVGDDPEAHRRRVHYVGHLDAVKPVLTVHEQLAGWGRLSGLSRRHAGDGAGDALARLGIDHLADVPGRYLSAGQRRRVALARVLVAPAPLWLLDEPRTALDADAVARLDDAIGAHRAAGGMVVLSLHGGGDPDGATVLDLAAFTPSDDGLVPC